VKIEFNSADQSDVALLRVMLNTLFKMHDANPVVASAAIAAEAVATVVEARAAFEEAAEAAPLEPAEAVAALQAEAQAAGEYAPPLRRRGRPPKNPKPVSEPAPANAEPPVSGQGQAQSGSPVPAGSAPVLPTTALEMIYNRDGAAVALSCLQRFGVTRIRDLQAEQVPEFVLYCQGVIAGTEKPLEGAQ
jgi:hypothetical protein